MKRPKSITNTFALQLALLSIVPLAACSDIDELDPELDLGEGLDTETEEGEEIDVNGDLSADALATDGLAADALASPESDETVVKHYLCCELDFSTPFQIHAVIPNPQIWSFPYPPSDCTDYFAGEHNVKYTIYHTWGSPAPYTGTTAPIPMGTTRVINLSHSGYLNADSCVAWYET